MTAGKKGGTREGKEGVEGRDYGGKLPLRQLKVDYLRLVLPVLNGVKQ